MHRPGNILYLIAALLLLNSCKEKISSTRDYPVRPVPFTEVRLTDPFWAGRIRINHEVTIPIAFQKAEETGRIRNFRIAGGSDTGHFCSLYPFDDSDVFKNIEAASYSLRLFKDPELDSYLDSLISYIEAAQEEDGYIYTNRTIDPENTHSMAGKSRWELVDQHSHELYNAGHLYEAAVAHYQATGKRSLLDVALKNADLVDSTFGWGKLEKVPGHQEIEIGLVKLYRATGDNKYIDLAKFFLDCRGPGGPEYSQQHLKVVDQDSAVGHAVRAQYMYAAMADVAALTGDQGYRDALDRIWEDVIRHKTYITGGIGAAGEWEGFGPPYFLPNKEAYCETCAAIANALWNYRMFLLEEDAKYMDIFERVLWNGIISGVSQSGDLFFYPNPLAADSTVRRKPWFGCACCPVNITRFLPSIPGYIYAISGDQVYVNLYMNNTVSMEAGGNRMTIKQETSYPATGVVSLLIDIEAPGQFELKLRIPGWARNEAFPSDLYFFEEEIPERPEITVNHKEQKLILKDGYACINRMWSAGDLVDIYLPMPVRKIRANSKVNDDRGRIAIQRGPIVYALEGIDQPGGTVANLLIDPGSQLSTASIDSIMDKGVIEITGAVNMITLTGNGQVMKKEASFRAVPYYLWANRKPGDMKVWIPVDEKVAVEELMNQPPD